MSAPLSDRGEALAAIDRIVAQRDALRTTLKNAIACLDVALDALEEYGSTGTKTIRADIAAYRKALEAKP